MAQLLNRLSKTLHQATQEFLDLFAINADVENVQETADISDTDD